MPSTPQHSIAFELTGNTGNETKLEKMGPSVQPDHVEDLDFPMAPALPKIKNNKTVSKRINSAGGVPPKLTSENEIPGKEKLRKAVSVGGSPKKVSPANGGGPVKSKLVGWGSKKVTPSGSPTKLETDAGDGPKITDEDLSPLKAPAPDVWIPKHSLPATESPGTLEELVNEPIFLEPDKKQMQTLTNSNNLLDEELITEELRLDEKDKNDGGMEVGLYTVRREALSKGELGGWEWTRTGFNLDPGLSVSKGTHHREYFVSSRVHGGAEIMVSRNHGDFSQLHRALQTRWRGNLQCC